MTPIDPSNVHRILIRANNWIGDVVMISPAIRAIRARFDAAKISILAKKWVLDTLEGNPDYDELIEYDRTGIHRGLAGRLRLVRTLRRHRFDLAVLFQKAFEAAALARLAGVRNRVGYDTDFRGALLTHPLPLPPPGTHHLEVFLGVARALGCDVSDRRPTFHIDAGARGQAGDILRGNGYPTGQPVVAIHPGASKPPRAWHADRFGVLARRLAETCDARILLVGGPGDHEMVGLIRTHLPMERVLTTPGTIPIRVMAALLERCQLFVGNDSGPMHIAAALGVPTVALFGPGDPERTAPRWGPGPVTAITRRYPCSPCRQDFFHECPPAPSGKPFCLEEIHVDEVEEKACALLRRTGAVSIPLK